MGRPLEESEVREWIAGLSTAADRPTRDELLLRDVWGAMRFVHSLVDDHPGAAEDVEDFEDQMQAGLLRIEGKLRALGDSWLAQGRVIDAQREALEDINHGLWGDMTAPEIIGSMRTIAAEALAAGGDDV